MELGDFCREWLTRPRLLVAARSRVAGLWKFYGAEMAQGSVR